MRGGKQCCGSAWSRWRGILSGLEKESDVKACQGASLIAIMMKDWRGEELAWPGPGPELDWMVVSKLDETGLVDFGARAVRRGGRRGRERELHELPEEDEDRNSNKQATVRVARRSGDLKISRRGNGDETKPGGNDCLIGGERRDWRLDACR